MPTIQVVEYLDASNHSPYARWFDSLNALAAAKVATAIYRLSEGNFSNVKGVGGGVFELRIDFGPGYRVYFGKDGDLIVILLGGSSKKDQQRAIAAATKAWLAYRQAKRNR
ncbi:MAG TPA: type II toxin-antitoxin system RelE/ParE family toxin [Burkholderiales bacterium]|nr:type II toxin-antitoxin system RelE/ParE family toxin [Burkholderiales bacterium]